MDEKRQGQHHETAKARLAHQAQIGFRHLTPPPPYHNTACERTLDAPIRLRPVSTISRSQARFAAGVAHRRLRESSAVAPQGLCPMTILVATGGRGRHGGDLVEANDGCTTAEGSGGSTSHARLSQPENICPVFSWYSL
jgi:hypothetical protein